MGCCSKIGCGEIENLLKAAEIILLFSQKIVSSPAEFQKAAEIVGIRVGKPPENG